MTLVEGEEAPDMEIDGELEELLKALQVDALQLEPFFTELSREEAIRRLRVLCSWMAVVNAYNHDGVVLTPSLIAHLAQPRDLDALLAELDRYREDTRCGRFRVDNALQRDLEFRRFKSEYQTFFGRNQPSEELYEIFTGLGELPSARGTDFPLDEQHLLGAKRAAYEAVGLLEFLRGLRSETSRPIVVIGNDKAQLGGGGYGRQWVVEPIEEHLSRDFVVRYDRVISHATMRLNMASPFPKDFVKEMCREMPHIVIVDGGRVLREQEPRATKGRYMVRFSRASRSYANWFALFNDLRAQGDLAVYQEESLFTREHLAASMKWHEYVAVREQIQRWVTSGQTYGMALWSPAPTQYAILGETEVAWPTVEFKGDRPLMVLANPIIYQSEMTGPASKVESGDDERSRVLSNSRPFYLDGLDREVRETAAAGAGDRLTYWGAKWENPALSVFGFGPHGFEMRVTGPSMESVVALVQERITAEVNRLLQST